MVSSVGALQWAFLLHCPLGIALGGDCAFFLFCCCAVHVERGGNVGNGILLASVGEFVVGLFGGT